MGEEGQTAPQPREAAAVNVLVGGRSDAILTAASTRRRGFTAEAERRSAARDRSKSFARSRSGLWSFVTVRACAVPWSAEDAALQRSIRGEELGKISENLAGSDRESAREKANFQQRVVVDMGNTQQDYNVLEEIIQIIE